MPDFRKIFSLPATRNYVDLTRLNLRNKKKSSLRQKKKKMAVRPAAKKAKKSLSLKRIFVLKKRPKPVQPAKIKPVKEEKKVVVGKVTHFFDKIQVAILKIKSPVRIGDTIHFKGPKTDFVQRVDSMQIDHQQILIAKKGDEIGLKVKCPACVGDLVFQKKN